MSEYELHVLITDHLRDMHGMVEFWVGIYQDELVRAGMSPFEQPQPLFGIMVVLVLGLFAVGTAAAVYFLIGRGWKVDGQTRHE